MKYIFYGWGGAIVYLCFVASTLADECHKWQKLEPGYALYRVEPGTKVYTQEISKEPSSEGNKKQMPTINISKSFFLWGKSRRDLY